MTIPNLRERISGKSLDRSDHHHDDDDDTKSISSATARTTSMSSSTHTHKTFKRPTLGAFFGDLSKQQGIIAPRPKLNEQEEIDVRKNRKASIFASLDKFIDKDGGGDQEDEVTVATTESASASHKSLDTGRSRPPLALALGQRKQQPKRHDSSQSVGGAAPPRKERYRRRGSVTKFSLDDQQEQDGSSPPTTDDIEMDIDDTVSMAASIGGDSVQSDSVLQLQNKSNISAPRQRYRRRGSVTKYSLEEPTTEQAPQKDTLSSSSNHSALPVSTIGGDSNGSFTPLEQPTLTQEKKKVKKPKSKKNFDDNVSLSSVGVKKPKSKKNFDDNVSLSSVGVKKPKSKKNFDDDVSLSSVGLDSVQSDNVNPRRYRRRGSVTKFSLESTPEQQVLQQKDNTLSSSSNHSLPPVSTIGGDTGSFTSLEPTQEKKKVKKPKSKKNFDGDVSLSSIGVDSVQSDSVYQTNKNSAGNTTSTAPQQQQKYRRRGSVTQYSLEPTTTEEKPRVKKPKSKKNLDANVSLSSVGVKKPKSKKNFGDNVSLSSVGVKKPKSKKNFDNNVSISSVGVKKPKSKKNFDDNVSLSSVGVDSVQSDNASPRRYRRRGSVTKFSLESTPEQQVPQQKDTLLSSSSNHSLPPVSTIGVDSNGAFSLDNVSELCYDEDGLGYGSMHSAPPCPRATPSPDPYGYGEETTDSVSQQRPPRKERCPRRGSVTKYSLEAQDEVKKELEDSSNHSLPACEEEELAASKKKKKKKKSNTDEASRPPRHPRKNRLATLPAEISSN
jgi:aryl carrier-like protein